MIKLKDVFLMSKEQEEEIHKTKNKRKETQPKGKQQTE
jgi:hypothetical protein